MKKKIITSLTLCFLLMAFVFSACSSESKIESINGIDTVYRYTIKQIELIDSTAEKENILETNTQFKYYYCDDELITMHFSIDDTDSGYYTAEYIDGGNIQKYFEEIKLKKTEDSDNRYDYYSTYKAYSTKYQKFVTMRVILGKCDKEYRPELTTKDGLATVKYYNVSMANGERYCIAKKDATYSDYKSARKDYQKQLFELRNDEKAVEELEEKFNDSYDFTAIITENTSSVNLNSDSIRIVYNAR